jgi:hypothetical protein
MSEWAGRTILDPKRRGGQIPAPAKVEAVGKVLAPTAASDFDPDVSDVAVA